MQYVVCLPLKQVSNAWRTGKTWPAFYCKQSKTGRGKAWERGWVTALCKQATRNLQLSNNLSPYAHSA